MLLQRMTYNLDKMQSNPKYKKLLSHSLGAGFMVGGSISMWTLILLTVFLLFSRYYEVLSTTIKAVLIIGLILVFLGIVIGGILDHKLAHNKLKKGTNKLSDKTIRKLNVCFVIVPYLIACIAILGILAVVIITKIFKQ